MSRLCNSVPLFLITNWMQPAGTDALSRSNAYSRRPTLTVDVGVVHEPPPPVVLVVPPVVVPPVVVPDVVVDATTATPNVPFMPLAAWPGTVQRNANLPFFLNTTLIVA